MERTVQGAQTVVRVAIRLHRFIGIGKNGREGLHALVRTTAIDPKVSVQSLTEQPLKIAKNIPSAGLRTPQTRTPPEGCALVLDSLPICFFAVNIPSGKTPADDGGLPGNLSSSDVQRCFANAPLLRTPRKLIAEIAYLTFRSAVGLCSPQLGRHLLNRSASEASHRLGTTVGNAFNRSPRWSAGNDADITAETDDCVPKLGTCVRTTRGDSDVAHGATGRYLRRVSSEPDLLRARHWCHGDHARNKPNR